MKNINIKSFSLLVLFALPVALLAQETTSEPVKGFENSSIYKILFPLRTGEAVRNTFEHTTVINNSTTETNGKHSLDVAIQHRFGTMDKFVDLYGVYAPSNIRLNFAYGLTKDVTIGFGSCKTKNTYDLNWKYKILQQSDKFPVTLTYAGNVAAMLVEKKDLSNSKGEFNQTSRLSYFNEIMISRKINSHLSVQVGGYMAYYNMLDSASFNGEHMFYGATAVARYKFSPQSSVLLEYSHPLNVDAMPVATRPRPNLGIGFEVSTGNHQFQVFICNANGILNQNAKVYNINQLDNFGIPAWLIGFNITRQWGF